MARTGLCSRRGADDLIAAGRVKVNGIVVTDFATSIDPDKDSLNVDGLDCSLKSFIYVMLNKPPGYVTTRSDEQGRQTVMDLLPCKLAHLRPVGRLDMYSEGLILLTNDGQLHQRLTHPEHHMPKHYQVTVAGDAADPVLKRLSEGIELDDGRTLPAKVSLVSRNKSYTVFKITITEGRNRQIRRMCEAVGHKVTRLVRLGIGRLQLGQMHTGAWRYLTDAEVKLLFAKPAGN